MLSTVRGEASSALVLSHVTGDIRPEVATRFEAEYKKVTPGATLRTHEEILRFFTGLELVEPGLVQVPYWRPEEPEPPDADKVWFLGGAIGRKPGLDATARTRQ